jgi:hypothetical protein
MPDARPEPGSPNRSEVEDAAFDMNQEALSTIRPGTAVWITILALSVLALHVSAQSSDSVGVTIYRPSGSALGNTIVSCDHNKYKIVVNRDGQKLLRIERGRFVTLRFPIGHYTFKSTRSKTLEINLKAGGEYYIRPRQTCGGGFLAQEALELVTCQEATAEAQGLDPLDAKDIYAEKSLVENLRHVTAKCRERPRF